MSPPGAGPAEFERVRLHRVPLASTLRPEQALLALRDERRPFALIGAWAGGGAILGSEPLRDAGSPEDPFACLDDLPAIGEPAPGGGGAGGDPGGGGVPDGEVGRGVPRGAGDPAIGGGWFGYLGYQAGRLVERLGPGPPRPVPVPRASLAYYDHVLRFSAGRWWFEALWSPARAERLAERLEMLSRRLASPPPEPRDFSCGSFGAAPSRPGHLRAVESCLGYISRGDLYQANLSLRLEAEMEGDAIDLFAAAAARLRPAYGAYFGDPGYQLASVSPELFLRRQDDAVRSAPIKGTAERAGERAQAERQRQALERSDKDRAENVMIVDLVRNDLGRVCEYGSVTVTRNLEAEAHSGLWHLVSEVSGRLAPGTSDAELLRASFPPGSVTGAPKIKAMEVISTLESSDRELYTGTIGYASPLAGLELSVAIRTFELARGRVWLGVGGGVVADSVAESEYRECLTKARPLLDAIGGGLGADSRPAGPSPEPTRRPRPDPARGVFETLRGDDGEVHELEGHVERLRSSLASLYGLDPDPAALALEIGAAAPRTGAHRIRVAGGTEPGSGAIAIEVTPASPPFPAEAIRLRPLCLPGGLGAHKWADREILATDAGPGLEPLLVDLDGAVLESGWGNLWIVERGEAITPPADGRLLAGVTRAALLAAAAGAGLGVGEEAIDLERIRRAEEVFVTSAVRGVQAAHLDGQAVPSPGPVTERMARLLADRWGLRLGETERGRVSARA